MQSRQMRKWGIWNSPEWTGWKRSVDESQRQLGRQLDRDELELIRNYKPRLIRRDDEGV